MRRALRKVGRALMEPGRAPAKADRERWAGRDRGAASILVLAIGLVLVAAGLAGAAVGSARVGRHRAQVAADLGALAGAAQAIHGEAVACAAARRYVTANGGRMTICAVDGLEIVVRAVVPVMGRTASAAARAGPVYTPVGAQAGGRSGR